MKKLSITISDIENFKLDLISEEKSLKAIEKYMYDVHSFYMYLNNEEVSKERVIEYKRHLQNKYQLSTQNSMLVSVNKLLSFLNRQDCKVKLHKIQRKLFYDDQQVLNKQEYQKLLETAKKQNNRDCL